MAESDYIHKRDLPLYIDVNCYSCGKLCALSNTTEYDGRQYCGPCVGHFQRGAAVIEFLINYPDTEVIHL